jgi:hypothetical protein
MKVRQYWVVQNNALRLDTGTLKKLSIPHLYREAKGLPVGKQLDLLCAQFLVDALRPEYTSHDLVSSPPGPHAHAVHSHSINSVRRHLTDGFMSTVCLKHVQKALHSSAVAAAVWPLPS